MAAPKGNQYWKLRSKHGRDKLFATPELLWDAACEYFQWCQENPLEETKAFAFQGVITTAELPKMRAMTMSQLCFYLNCNEAYFRNFKLQLPEGEQDFNAVIRDIEQVIYNQKFQGAAAGLLDANIIARDLGLKDNVNHLNNGDDFKPTSITVSTSDQQKPVNALLKKFETETDA